MNTKQVNNASRLLRMTREIDHAPPTPEMRTQTIAAMEAALRSRSRRRTWKHAGYGVLALAAAAALALGGWKLRHKSDAVAQVSPPKTDTAVEPIDVAKVGVPTLTTPTPSGLALSNGSVLQAGSRIVAPPSRHVILAFSTGTRLAIEGGGDVTVVETGDVQKFALASGSVDAHVAKLQRGQRWLVTTPDAEVEVRGTAFTVSVVQPDTSCGNGTRTRVAVREGIVVVRGQSGNESRVYANQQWPDNCRRTASRATFVAPQASPPQAIDLGPTTTTDTSQTTQTTDALAASRSTLAEQNDAFAHAVLLRQHGDAAGCATELDRFLARFPSSPLVESARVERMRSLRTTDPTRAASEARDYLARYPSGFARSEAEAVAQGK